MSNKAFPYSSKSIKPAIYISPGIRISVNKNLLYVLGNPAYIQFWWSATENAFLIGTPGCNAEASFNICEGTYRGRRSLAIRNRAFMKALMAKACWHDEKRNYAVLGEYVPEINMVVFRIRDAVTTEVVESDV